MNPLTNTKANSVTITVDGRRTTAAAGVSLAAALVGDGRWTLRRNPVDGGPRGPFCGMGVCLECEVTVDGREAVRACLTRVRAGMRVDTGTRDDR
ncbi:2Fe-2S iron-sulfur cluster-binding protein [Acrocarpospora catenulata]|uniref:2Fe-2S iron-sulfur cluster-binding protein n=1 Tax=Acrocarpospora catenulata TaxID=2836182 RepID=UPI001BDA8AB7|nr:2Fe-2S iron-sulfur cluster-binding protein [Acrocarpospora catenulata]